MGDRDHGAGVLLQVLLEPQHALGVEVVRRLVEEQQVGLLQQELRERDAALLTAGEIRDGCIARRGAQRIHRLLELRVEVPRVCRVDLLLQRAHLGEQCVEVGIGVGHQPGDLVEPVDLRLDRDALLDVLEDGLGLVEHRLLHEDADGEAGRQLRLAVGRRVEPGHDLEDRRLSGAVRADHADLRAGQERHRDVVEDQLLADRLAGADHRVDVLSHAFLFSLGYPRRQRPSLPAATRRPDEERRRRSGAGVTSRSGASRRRGRCPRRGPAPRP